MNSGIFGPRGPSTPYFNPYANYQYAPQQYQQQSFQRYPLQPYPQHTLQPSQQQVFSPYSFALYSGQSPNLIPYLTSYNWSPDIVSSPKGVETILIAILVLVVLDIIFVRPFKA